MSLTGKTAIVTGGGRDIGRACALSLSKRGANVVVSYHQSAQGALDTVAEIEASGGKAKAVQADLSSQDGVTTLVSQTVDAFGAVDCLVNNAGGLVARKTVAEMDLAHWQYVMDLNVTSAFLMT